MEEREAEVIGVYVGHCLVKCAGVVLASRVLGSPRKPPDGKAKKWVGALLGEEKGSWLGKGREGTHF